MAEPNYLGFAQIMGQRNPIAEGVDQLSGTLSDIHRQGTEMEDRKRRNSLADLQMRSGELGLQQTQAAMDDSNARTNSLKALYQSPTLEGAYTAQAQAEMKQKEMERKQKGFETYLNTVKVIEGFDKITPESKVELNKHLLAQNPEYAPMAANLTFVDSKGVKAARQFAEGELKDPVTGQPLPAGYYETEGAWTGDINSPVKLVSYKLVEDKQLKHIPEGAAVPDGKGGFTIPAPRREKPIVINTGGGRGGGRAGGKAPSGYRYTDDGNLEAIPGGPAALKVDAALQGKEKAKGAYDSSIAVVDKLLAHPGRASGTGLSSKLDPRNYTPGTDAYDFQRELESFDSVLFLSNIEKMKGMGALSNAEGAKVSAAAGAIKPGMKDTTFVNNLRIIRAELNKAKSRIDSGNLIQPQGQGKPASKGKDPLGIL